jgi:uncharacterized membrane protein YidH (DUF202 family)
MRALGIVLIVFGILALVYGGFTYTHQKKVVDLGPIQASKKEATSTVPLPPILGVVAVIGGGALLFTSKR